MADVHPGSWFGLPDFGVTEKIGSLFGAPQTAQGGSNIFGGSNAQAPTNNQAGAAIVQQKLGGMLDGAPRPASTGTTGAKATASGPVWTGQGDRPVGWNGDQSNVNNATDQVRNDINSGYDGYFGQLDSILNEGLPGQKAAQEGIVNSQHDQGINQLDTQKALGVQDLNTQREKAGTQQAKTLKDLSDNIHNLFQSGNVYLGAKGAADSSASDQYSYALTKMGSQQRGDVTSQYAGINNDINGRETRLNEIHAGQVKDLDSQRDQQISSIAQWLGEQQNSLKQAKAQGLLQEGQDLAALSKDLLNVALQRLQTVQQEASQKRSMLDQWAMNHSNDINSLKSNLSSVSSTNYNMPSATPVSGMPATSEGAGNPSLFGYGGATDNQKTNIFGQPIG